MATPFYLALPRLHNGLVRRQLHSALNARGRKGTELPQPPIHTLWPGLPSPPKDAWAPKYQWSPEQAQACLNDLDTTLGMGISGAPVQNYLLELFSSSTSGLSPAEEKALKEFGGNSDKTPSPFLSRSGHEDAIFAQQVLLLAWYQECQTEELRELENQVAEKSRMLRGLLSETEPDEAKTSIRDTAHADTSLPMPEWETVLAAAWPFFTQLSEAGRRLCVVVTDQTMAHALNAPIITDDPDLWPGFIGMRLTKRQVLHGTPDENDSDTIFFMFPEECAD